MLFFSGNLFSDALFPPECPFSRTISAVLFFFIQSPFLQDSNLMLNIIFQYKYVISLKLLLWQIYFIGMKSYCFSLNGPHSIWIFRICRPTHRKRFVFPAVRYLFVLSEPSYWQVNHGKECSQFKTLTPYSDSQGARECSKLSAG